MGCGPLAMEGGRSNPCSLTLNCLGLEAHLHTNGWHFSHGQVALGQLQSKLQNEELMDICTD